MSGCRGEHDTAAPSLTEHRVQTDRLSHTQPGGERRVPDSRAESDKPRTAERRATSPGQPTEIYEPLPAGGKRRAPASGSPAATVGCFMGIEMFGGQLLMLQHLSVRNL